MAQGLSQCPGIDYEETYFPIMDVSTFRYLISLVVFKKTEYKLKDLVTSYLYAELDMIIPKLMSSLP